MRSGLREKGSYPPQGFVNARWSGKESEDGTGTGDPRIPRDNCGDWWIPFVDVPVEENTG